MLESTGSPYVVVGLLAYILFEKQVLSVHRVQMEKQTHSWHAAHVPCISFGLHERQSFPMNLEQMKDDSERGVIQNCLLSQDLKTY